MECKSLNDCFRGYLKEIEVSQEVKETLEDARLKIKRALTDEIGERTAREGDRIVPRFMRQGSAGYKTQNMPCCSPAQQVDLIMGAIFRCRIMKISRNLEKLRMISLIWSILYLNLWLK